MALPVQLQTAVTPVASTADGGGGSNGFRIVQGFREGSMSVVDFRMRMAAAGMVYNANFGNGATALAFKAFAANRPDAWIRVPTGVMLIPLRETVALESMAGTATIIDIRTCQNDIGNGTSAAATVAPTPTRTDALVAPNAGIIARQLATGDTTAETNPLSIWRQEYILANTQDGPKGADVLFDLEHWLVGPATWETYVSATSAQATGYITKTFIATPSNWWT